MCISFGVQGETRETVLLSPPLKVKFLCLEKRMNSSMLFIGGGPPSSQALQQPAGNNIIACDLCHKKVCTVVSPSGRQPQHPWKLTPERSSCRKSSVMGSSPAPIVSRPARNAR